MILSAVLPFGGHEIISLSWPQVFLCLDLAVLLVCAVGLWMFVVGARWQRECDSDVRDIINDVSVPLTEAEKEKLRRELYPDEEENK